MTIKQMQKKIDSLRVKSRIVRDSGYEKSERIDERIRKMQRAIGIKANADAIKKICVGQHYKYYSEIVFITSKSKAGIECYSITQTTDSISIRKREISPLGVQMLQLTDAKKIKNITKELFKQAGLL